MAMKNKRKKRKRSILEQIPYAIVYLSDAFVFLIVMTWIFYIINAVFGGWYELLHTGGTSIFTDLKDACTIPLTAGGVAWLIRTAANHLSAGLKGHRLNFDFPNVDDDGNVVDQYQDNDYGTESETAESSENEEPEENNAMDNDFEPVNSVLDDDHSH